jgi:hypothetical protein
MDLNAIGTLHTGTCLRLIKFYASDGKGFEANPGHLSYPLVTVVDSIDARFAHPPVTHPRLSLRFSQ